jgi:hypothetical protein
MCTCVKLHTDIQMHKYPHPTIAKMLPDN